MTALGRWKKRIARIWRIFLEERSKNADHETFYLEVNRNIFEPDALPYEQLSMIYSHSTASDHIFLLGFEGSIGRPTLWMKCSDEPHFNSALNTFERNSDINTNILTVPQRVRTSLKTAFKNWEKNNPNRAMLALTHDTCGGTALVSLRLCTNSKHKLICLPLAFPSPERPYLSSKLKIAGRD